MIFGNGSNITFIFLSNFDSEIKYFAPMPHLDWTYSALIFRYVKMYLLYNGQRIAKKKTHVKKRTLNPVFNESFVFEVPAAPNAALDHVSLELLVLDWDRVTKNEVC